MESIFALFRKALLGSCCVVVWVLLVFFCFFFFTSLGDRNTKKLPLFPQNSGELEIMHKLISKGTLVLHPWGSKTRKFGFII